MRRTTANRPYRWVAQYYDQIFGPLRRPIDLARRRVLGKILPKCDSACDLACGTGATALALARNGTRVFAVDLSPVMCRIVREKARSTSRPLRVIRADMRKFRLPESVDLVTCEGDALNHVPRKADLRLVAKAVARALQPGGYFYFDVNNGLGFERYWTGTQCFKERGLLVVMDCGHDPTRDRAWADFEWFIRDGRCWRRHHEHFEEVCWSSYEIRRTLREEGFDQLRAWDATPFFENNPLVRRGCRTIYLARKSPV